MTAGYLIIVRGTLTLKNGKITGCKNAGAGGAVNVNGNTGKFTMEDVTISGNTSESDSGGGGVYVINGSFTMSGNSEISDNKVTGDHGGGGGVYVDGGTFTMSGNSKISDNEATGVLSNGGGCVYMNKGTFNLSGTVDISGTGKYTIWAIANNGVRTSVKVTVK